MEQIELWDEDYPIDWQRKARIKANRAIRKYNNWSALYKNDIKETCRLLATLNKHYYIMNYSKQDGGSAYRNDLLIMKQVVEQRLIYLTDQIK